MITHNEQGEYTDDETYLINATICPACGGGGTGNLVSCFEVYPPSRARPSLMVTKPHPERIEAANQVMMLDEGMVNAGFAPRSMALTDEDVASYSQNDVEAEVQRRLAEHLADVQEAHAREVEDAYTLGFSAGRNRERDDR